MSKISKIFPKFVLLIAVSVFLVGCTTAETETPSTDSTPPSTQNEETTTETGVQSYTQAEVAANNSAASCWLVVEGKVYDVTSYIGRHPGGDEILEGCGQPDATNLFETKGGRGVPHSGSAEAQLESYLIGELE